MTDIYQKLAHHLDDLPGGFPSTESGVELRILRRLFTPDQAELALHLTLLPEQARVIAYRAKIPHQEAERRLDLLPVARQEAEEERAQRKVSADTEDRPLLILDLDETLIRATVGEPPGGCDFRTKRYHVVKRPHLDRFLETTADWYEHAVWSSSGDDYAQQVAEEVFRRHATPRFVWARSRCTLRYDEERCEYYYLKNLGRLRRQGVDLERVLMIDDSPEKLRRNYGNLVTVYPFEGQAGDRELLNLLPFLEWLKDQPEFRRVEKRDWRNFSG